MIADNKLTRRLLVEFEITWRMLADNMWASFTPGLVLVVAVCLRERITRFETAVKLSKAIILCSLYTYTFDAANQAKGVEEDTINKPYRPIPRGLLTPKGALQRFWTASIVYAVTAWSFGVVRWALLWTSATIVINIWCPPRHYFWCKTLCMACGVCAQLAQAWQLVNGTIDETGWRWISFMALAFPPPLVFEDVGDMLGDKAIGRRTLALLLGAWPIRIWFATTTALLPVLVNRYLSQTTAACVCWTAGARSIMLRTVRTDRITYQIFISIYIVVLLCGCILWA